MATGPVADKCHDAFALAVVGMTTFVREGGERLL
jgi:hypothetical protein